MRREIFAVLGLCLLFSEYMMATSSNHIHNPTVCNTSTLLAPTGIISSPNYPYVYPNYTSCSWVILSPPKTVLTIVVIEIDIEEDVNCDYPPCCQHSWLSLPKEGGRGTHQYCGHKMLLNPISVSQESTNIKFHTSKVVKGGRGFQLKYTTEPISESVLCTSDEIECADGRCVARKKAFLCDISIDVLPRCEDGLIPCGLLGPDCFNNVTQRCNGIKDCSSGLDELNCGNCFPDELMCQSGEGCYKAHQKCDIKPDCGDFSDEIDCGFCGDGQVLCSSIEGSCFSPRLERCNGKFDCPLGGEDEVGCSKRCPDDKLACSNEEGCYSPSQRCDSIHHCRDHSDETNCPACTSIANKFLCDNGRCISDHLWCNDVNDCGDGSDEHCLKNSIITTAIMGSLICGLLLVVAVGCVCRLYGLRVTASGHGYQLQRGQAHRASRPTFFDPDDEFFRREPPPAYSVATADTQQLRRLPPQNHVTRIYSIAPTDQNNANSRQQHRSRSSRRHINSRRRSQRSQGRNTSPSDSGISRIARSRPSAYANLPTLHSQTPVSVTSTDVRETSLEARQESMIGVGDNKDVTLVNENMLPQPVGAVEQEHQLMDVVNISSVSSSPSSSSTNSPSRGSVTSSTSVMSYLSGNDDTQLLIA